MSGSHRARTMPLATPRAILDCTLPRGTSGGARAARRAAAQRGRAGSGPAVVAAFVAVATAPEPG